MKRNADVVISPREAGIQKDYIEKVRKMIEPQKQKYYITTFGCQMNAHDSEKLAGMLAEMGYSPALEEDSADIVVYNTCCVRENAENKVYGNLGYLKHLKENGRNIKIALCGCMMQQDAIIERIRKVYSHVDIIFGTYNLYRLPELLCCNLETGSLVIDVWKEHGEIVEDLPSVREYSFKAGVNIMYGCNNFCSYCIVPYVRGRERSREPGDVIKEIQELATDGVKEITLLGQNVNSYGLGLGEKVDFADLLYMAAKVEGIERIRFMTSHPKDLSPRLIEAIQTLKKVCNHIHLPLQSGSSAVLRKMNRRYTKEEYISLVEKIRETLPGISVTTDIIVGFPGETEEDFAQTLEVVEKAGFNGAFTFLYSKRSGTPAAVMDNQVEEAVAKERFQRLLDTLNQKMDAFNRARLGSVLPVLGEEYNPASGIVTGRGEDNTLVHFPGVEDDLGEIRDIKILSSKTFYLTGEKIL